MRTYDHSTYAELGLMEGFPPPRDKRVDAFNGLWDPPYNRWAYQHMRCLVPSRGFGSAGGPVELPRRIDDRIDKTTVKRTDGSTVGFETFLEETFTDSFVAVADGEVVYERYFNGMSRGQPHQMMSCTKSFVGLFALLAVERGQVSESDRVGELIPEVDNGGAFADARLGQVLDMTSSMSFNEVYDEPGSDVREYCRIVRMGPALDGPLSADGLYGYLQTLRRNPDLNHGEIFHYQTPKTDMANWVANRATGRSLLEEFDALWRRLGTDGEAYLLLDPAGTPIAGGGLNATAIDLARFATMVANDGTFKGEQVIPAAVLDKLSAGGSVEAFLNGPEAKGEFGSGEWSYRGFWWVRHTPGRQAIVAIGVNGQWIYCDRARRLAIVKQSSLPVAAEPEFDDYTVHGFDAVVDALG